MNSFIELSFEEMLIEFPTDTHDTFALIFKELYSQLNPSQKSTFIKELASTFEKISLQLKTLSEKYNRFESKLMMFPKILHHLVDDIKGNSFLSFFDSFNRIEESKMSKSTQACLALGRELIQKHSAELSKLISLQTRQMDPARPLITPIVFVAECAQVNPHLSSQIGDLQSDLEKLLIIDDKQFLTNLAKQLRYLIKFLKDPEAMYERLFANILRNSAKDKLMGHCYFIAGLLKGLGIRFLKKTNIIAKMQKIFDNSVKKDYKDIHVKVRKGCVMLSEALWLVFDRLFEPCLKQLLDFLLKFLGDTNEEVRTLTSDVMKKVMSNISEFGIKQILPVLMKGTTHKNSKIKRNSILALGSIANCGTKQLSKNLPKIVPQLTEATNDTNDLVNSAAKKSLSLILGTIKSPEVMGLRDVLIKSLSDPYKHNQRCLEAILKTKFKHALDGPSLSLIVPVALYGCKSLNPDKSKKMASQLIASMIDLVPQASDFLPHLDLLMNGLEENLKDLSSEVRAMAAKAFAALTRKFRNETGMKLLNQLKEILQGEDANSTERAGYAQAFAEVLYSLGPEMAKTLIPQALKLTQDSREHIRESFLSVFVYIPMVMGNLFIDFVPTTIEYVVESISHEKEKIRNLAIKSLKTVIQNYLQNDFQVLLRPLFEGCLDENENKKNSSLILLGDIIQMLFEDDSLTRDFIYKNYSRIFSLFYIVKNDESSLMRETAKNIYKTFIPNTQRCLRIIFKDLHHCFIELFSREKDSVHTLARNGLIEFGNKFADTFASEMLLLADDVLRKRVTRHSEITSTPNWKDQLNLTREISKIEALLAGQSRFIAEFVANCNNHALRKVKNLGLVNVNDRLCNFEKEIVWNPAFVGLRTFVDRENKVDYIKTRLTEYSKKLSENEYQFKNSGKETEKTTQENDKMKKFFTILLQSRKEIILKETTSFLFTKEFSEWQFEVILQNLKLFGNLLYENGPLKSGLDLLFDSYNKKLNQYGTNMTIGQQEFLTMNKFTLNTLSVNIDPNNILILIQEFEDKLKLYSNNKNGPMIVVTLQSLSYFFEKSVLEDIQFPFTLCAESLRLIAFQGSNQKEIFDNVGAFLEIMFRFYNKENCTEIMTGIYNTLKEIVTNNDNYQGLENMKVIHCLFSLINQVIRYSTPESTLMALKTAKFMVKTLPKELLEKDQRNLYSALLRLLIYQYTPRKSKSLIMKKKLFSFMNFLLEKEIDMGSLCHQFFIYLVMLMNSEYKKEQENKKEDEEQVVNKEEVTENVMNEEEDKDEKTIKKKTMQKMTLREVYMDYTLNLGKYFKCTMGYLSSWKRKVDNDATYYHKQPFTDFLNLVKQQPEDVVSSTVKADIQKILG
jgi:HEAT repeat protein